MPHIDQQRCFVPDSPASTGASTPKAIKHRLHAGANSSSFGSATPRSTHSIREATTGTRLGRPHPATRRLLPSLRELIAFPSERTFWSPQPKVPAAISVENRWLPRARRELVFSSRGRRHAARPITNIPGGFRELCQWCPRFSEAIRHNLRRDLTHPSVLANSLPSRSSPPSAQVEADTKNEQTDT